MTSFKLLGTIYVIYSLISAMLAKPTSPSDDEMNLDGLESSEEGFAETLIELRILTGNDEREKNLELGKLYQGDMKLETEQLEALLRNESEQARIESRTGLLRESYRWPKNSEGKVVVPYSTEGFSKFFYL